MKILYIANIRIPTEKAHGIQIMKMCEAFSNSGHDVTLVVPRRLNRIKDNPFKYYGVKENFKIKKLPTLDLVKFDRIGFLVQALVFSKFALLYSFLNKSDIIYSRDELSLWFLSFFKKNVVWEAHTPRKNFIIKSLVKRVHKIVTISGGLKKFYTDIGVTEDNVLVQHDGVDTEQFSVMDMDKTRDILDLPKGKKIIGYIGKYKTMGKAKGVDELIDAFAVVYKDMSDALLLLVGINKEEMNEVTEKLQSVGLEKEAYHVVGHVPQKEVPFYLSSSDILIMNYPNAEHYALYMSPLKLFEYMAVERPIISTDLPVVREILSEDNAYLVPPDDVNSLITSIKEILNNNDVASVRAKQSRSDVLKYTWKGRVESILKFIK